jgi:hypothetical protein
VPQTFFNFTQLSCVHFEQCHNLPQGQMLLLPVCWYFLIELAFHGLNFDFSNVGKVTILADNFLLIPKIFYVLLFV